MTTLTALAASTANDDLATWEARKSEFVRDISEKQAKRSALFPAELAALPDLPDVDSFGPAPALVIGERTYPQLDKTMLLSSLVHVNGIWAPAFALYDLDQGSNTFSVTVDCSGSVREFRHRYDAEKMQQTWSTVVGMARHHFWRRARYWWTAIASVSCVSSLAAAKTLDIDPTAAAVLTFVFLLSLVYTAATLLAVNSRWTDESESRLLSRDVHMTCTMKFVLPDRIRAHAHWIRKQTAALPSVTALVWRPSRMAASHAVEHHRFSLLVVEEARNWDLEIVQRPPVLDPLLVIRDNTTNTYYLADTFDMTPVEEFLAREGSA